MNVASWYDQGTRLSGDANLDSSTHPTVVVESWYDNDRFALTGLPAGLSASAAEASPQLAVKALKYEADILEMQARMDAFPKKEGTMFGA